MTRKPDPSRYASILATEVHAARAAGRSTVQRRLTTILNKSGWVQRSPQNLTRIGNAIEREELFLDTDITDMDISLDAWITISTQRFHKRTLGRVFSREDQLSRHLRKYAKQAFSGVPNLEGLKFHRSEKRIEYAGEERRVDLIYKDENDAQVVVELERGDPKDESVPQLERYLKGLSEDGTSVRGVLITARPKSAQLETDIADKLDRLSGRFDVEWYWYNINVELKRLY